jgi:hypothetical protein
LELLLRPDVQEFIDSHLGTDIDRLALQRNPFPDVNWQDIIRQIAAKTKAKSKLPTWYQTRNIIWPGRVSLEQTSSEAAARYKATLISGETMIDVSGGLGVDDYYFSKKVGKLTHCELDTVLSSIVEHNFKQLGVANVICHAGDSSEFLQDSVSYDWIYADPARRNNAQGKVFKLSECQPDVTVLLPLYYKHSDNILIKTAPLLDITSGLSELDGVRGIHIVAVENEVKELLWILNKDYKEQIEISCVNILKTNTQKFSFFADSQSVATYGLPSKYLYEPNSAIMKSGGFDEVSQQFGLAKLHANTHLYTSDKLIDFPGRRFNIEQQIPYSKTALKEHLASQKFNVSVRNFPDTVEQIRKKWKIKDGGSRYSFVTTDMNENKIVLICTKID